MPRDLWWDNLKRLSVRIMDSEFKHLGSGLLYRHDENNVFVLTACHVINCFGQDDAFLVECQPNEGEESQELRDKYTFRVKGSDVRSYYAHNTFPEKTYCENDAAVIKLDVDGRDWLTERKQAMFPPKTMGIVNMSVAGYGYPMGKNSKNEELISSSSEKTNGAICCVHTKVNHRVEWKLGISVSDPYSDDETGGWSGCVLVMAETEPMVMAGSAFAIYSGYKFQKFRGADLYYHRELLETEFEITVNEAVYTETARTGRNGHSLRSGFTPSLPHPGAWIDGSRQSLTERLKDLPTKNNPLYLCGPAGVGKTEVARDIALKHEIGASYTIQYRLSEITGEENMRASLLAAECDGRRIIGGSKDERDAAYEERMEKLRLCGEQAPLWIIIDDFYHPRKPLEMLLHESSFKRLLELGHYLICTTRYSLRGYNRCEIPYLYEDKEEHKRALLEQMGIHSGGAVITPEQFDEYFDLTNGNLLLASWTAKTLETFSVTMSDILHALKTGDFSQAAFESILDERTGQEASLKDHILGLYNWEWLEPEEEKLLALLQFADTEGILPEVFKNHLSNEQQQYLNNLKRSSWCKQDMNGHKLDHVLKIACRCKALTPDHDDLKTLLWKMYKFYQTSKSSDYRAVIEAYFHAVSAYFDEEMRQWYNEIRSA